MGFTEQEPKGGEVNVSSYLALSYIYAIILMYESPGH